MRTVHWLLILFLGLVIAPVAFWFFERPWVEVLGDSVLRTSAPLDVVAEATHAVIERHQNFILNDDGSKSDPTFSSTSRSWSTGQSSEQASPQVVRARTEIADKEGHRLSIERITTDDRMSLLFVEYGGEGGPGPILSELFSEFETRTVANR